MQNQYNSFKKGSVRKIRHTHKSADYQKVENHPSSCYSFPFYQWELPTYN